MLFTPRNNQSEQYHSSHIPHSSIPSLPQHMMTNGVGTHTQTHSNANKNEITNIQPSPIIKNPGSGPHLGTDENLMKQPLDQSAYQHETKNDHDFERGEQGERLTHTEQPSVSSMNAVSNSTVSSSGASSSQNFPPNWTRPTRESVLRRLSEALMRRSLTMVSSHYVRECSLNCDVGVWPCSSYSNKSLD